MEKQATLKRRYITGFDGLRALAVLGVISFHLWPHIIVGGWIGVPLFFVLSGYLITDILIQEYDKTGNIKILSFWIRRLKRLMPALFCMLFLTSIMIFCFFKSLIYNMRSIVFTNFIYIYNFWIIKHGISYFDQWNNPSPFIHLWSLSIEGQFYLFWPFIVLFLLKLKFSRSKISGSLLISSVVSAVLMALFYNKMNVNRVYYGTDTRLFAVILGASLAFIWPSNKLKSNVKFTVKRSMDIIGWITLGVVILAIFVLNGQWLFTYYGGMFLITLIITILVAITAHPASYFSKLFDRRILQYFGTRSYSIYLYQLPIFVFYSQFVKRPMQMFDNIIEIILVLLVSEISYRYIEKVFKSNLISSKIYIAIILLLLIGGLRVLMSPEAGKDFPRTNVEKRLMKNKKQLVKANKKANEITKNSKNKEIDNSAINKDLLNQYGISNHQFNVLQKIQISSIGDSLLLNSAPNLQKIMPQMTVDAETGRQVNDVIKIIEKLNNQHDLANNVLITSGTNGTVSNEQIEQVMDLIGKKRTVYWVNNFADRDWIIDNNKNLQQQSKKHCNLKVVDWNELVIKHKEWLGDDNVHPNSKGSIEYTKNIIHVILKSKK